MFASLPMYDRLANAAAHDRLWVLIRDRLRARGIKAPDALDRGTDPMAGWAREDLVLGQICNLPYRARFKGRVTIIGAMDYGLPECDAGFYRSAIIVPKDAPDRPPKYYATARFAANMLGSHSGYGAPQAWAKAHGFLLPSPTLTGSHDASLRAVAEGRADIAALDLHTWMCQNRDMPQAKQVRVLDMTTQSPGMSLITRQGQDPAPYRAAITEAIAAMPADDSSTLGLRSVIALPASTYDLPMPPLPQPLE